ncbi:hypothetical protein [uncultured Peptoniphilus sp.]|uniref:hypothetical protein n=1 Tax=uncultured Peptoniphilus sp. TaxID=254354 RepID=UPI00258B54E4|nr:hypothetical protein [uncultured Peptoniphilus sp.]
MKKQKFFKFIEYFFFASTTFMTGVFVYYLYEKNELDFLKTLVPYFGVLLFASFVSAVKYKKK